MEGLRSYRWKMGDQVHFGAAKKVNNWILNLELLTRGKKIKVHWDTLK